MDTTTVYDCDDYSVIICNDNFGPLAQTVFKVWKNTQGEGISAYNAARFDGLEVNSGARMVNRTTYGMMTDGEFVENKNISQKRDVIANAAQTIIMGVVTKPESLEYSEYLQTINAAPIYQAWANRV